MNNNWIFEPCGNDTERDDKGALYPHAVQGIKPQGRRVMGYGHEEEEAYIDARRAAQRYDAREVLGERGEVLPQTAKAPAFQRVNIRAVSINGTTVVTQTRSCGCGTATMPDTDLLTRYGGLS